MKPAAAWDKQTARALIGFYSADENGFDHNDGKCPAAETMMITE